MSFNFTLKESIVVSVATILGLAFVSHLPVVGAVVKFILGF